MKHKATSVERKERRIRERTSYRRFKQFLDFLDTKPTKSQILRHIHTDLDSQHRYGYATQANHAGESLDLLIKDKKLK